MMSSISRSDRFAKPAGPWKGNMRVLERPFFMVSRMKPSETLFRKPGKPMAVPVPPAS